MTPHMNSPEHATLDEPASDATIHRTIARMEASGASSVEIVRYVRRELSRRPIDLDAINALVDGFGR